jgi:hypothetical protein
MLIELVLTIFAWRKGWGPIALLPLAVGITLGVLFSSLSNSMAPALMADVLIYAALITMIAVRRKPAVAAQTTPVAVQEVTRPTAA